MTSLLGIDYGPRRIGLAASDPERRLAVPLGVHDSRRDGSILARLGELAREREAGGIVIGLPLTADGREGPMAARAREFAAKVEAHTGLPVTLVDERYTSREAASRLRAGERRRIPRGEVDAVSAQILLQSHLDALRAAAEREPE